MGLFWQQSYVAFSMVILLWPALSSVELWWIEMEKRNLLLLIYYYEKDTLEVDTGSDTNNGGYWELCTFYFTNFPTVPISTSFYQNLMRESQLCILFVSVYGLWTISFLFYVEILNISMSLPYILQLPTCWRIMVMWVFPRRLICSLDRVRV